MIKFAKRYFTITLELNGVENQSRTINTGMPSSLGSSSPVRFAGRWKVERK